MSIVATEPVAKWSRRLTAAGVLCLLLTAGGCAVQSPFTINGGLQYDESLRTGERLFGEPVPAHERTTDILEPSQAMLDYVSHAVRRSAPAARRFRELFDSLTDDGFFGSVYSADRTLTAAETFEARSGNCLAYTNMFVALARAAGLDARFQIVDTPPAWDADAGFLIRYTHINVLLKDVRLKHASDYEVIVDFNVVRGDPEYQRREVSDAYAESLFYANRSATLMRQGRFRESFANLRSAIDITPGNVDLWNNLGAFYATQGDFDSSVEAHQVALQIDPRSESAFSGLARSYASAGSTEMANFYYEKVRNNRVRNPYYYFAMAQVAYKSADFEISLEHINTAIDLSRRVGSFHFLKGLLEYQLGDAEAARASLERAGRYGLDRSAKLDLLRSLGEAKVNPS
ncbi:MAG: tetratricopeptide repeat protein [Woeseiaceae bacterium]